MKLIYRLAIRLSLVLVPLIALWGVLFYFMLEEEINDETDDALEEYSDWIIVRFLAGQELPPQNMGSNNGYTIRPVDEVYAKGQKRIHYYDAEFYMEEQDDEVPARILSTIFQNESGDYYELKVATPTFEKDDLFQAIMGWTVVLYVLLMVTVVGLTVWVFHRNMRPLYSLLHWLDGYVPGRAHAPVPNDTRITEFRRLNEAAQQAADRADDLFERQKQFIGNASHELQTPLAVLGNRIEWLLDSQGLTEEQMRELFKMQRTLRQAVRLNKTLLLLTRIENRQFPECVDVDLVPMIREQALLYDEVYADSEAVARVETPDTFIVRMNESLASTLVSNLLRNAYLHREGGEVRIVLQGRSLTVSNDGTGPLDADHIFDRFYQGNKREGSTGLGLALVQAVCRYYGLAVHYRFEQGRHIFTVEWP